MRTQKSLVILHTLKRFFFPMNATSLILVPIFLCNCTVSFHFKKASHEPRFKYVEN